MKKQNKILIIGDLHMRESLGYNQYITDGRKSEKLKILNYIIKQSEDCETAIMLGDQFNGRSNPAEIIREFVEFIERFGNKKIIMISGNHCKSGDGKTAIDFLKEIKNKNWTIITNKIEKIGNMTFCPYFNKSELGVKSDLAATKKIMGQLEKNDILFIHHAISDTFVNSGVETSIFNEPIIPKKELEKIFKLIVAGHIHSPQADGKTIIAGNIFCQEVGEHQKYIWKIKENLEVEQIKLPGRGIYLLKNPANDEINKISDHNIVKVILTVKQEQDYIDAIKDELIRFDAHLFLEQYPSERKKTVVDDNILDYDVEKLLEIYTIEKKIDFKKLKSAFELIR